MKTLLILHFTDKIPKREFKPVFSKTQSSVHKAIKIEVFVFLIDRIKYHHFIHNDSIITRQCIIMIFILLRQTN
jgi:hypothetical protein